MNKDELYTASVKLDFKEPDKYDWMTSLLVFGTCVYKSEVIDGVVTVRFIHPYTKEFDEAMFADDCNENYTVSDELIKT